MAFPIGALIGAVGSGSQGVENQNANTGVGVRDDVFSKILGPLAPQFYINTAANRAEKQRQDKRQAEFDDINKRAGNEQIKASINSRQNADRAQGMSGIALLANQRAQAMNSFNNQKLKDSFYKAR